MTRIRQLGAASLAVGVALSLFTLMNGLIRSDGILEKPRGRCVGPPRLLKLFGRKLHLPAHVQTHLRYARA